VLFSEAERSVGYYAAIIFNSQYGIVKPVNLDEISCDEVFIRVFFLRVLQGVSFLLLLDHLHLFLLCIVNHFLVDEVGGALEKASQRVIQLSMLGVELGERVKFKVVGSRIEETLCWELVFPLIGQSGCDVVVVLEA